MMIGLILKNWKLILDIAIIAAVVILVFVWNPFNLFGSGLKLQSTANMVSKINEIGELITAEYYGEVIAHDNLQEVEIEQPNYFDETGSLLYLELKDSLFSYFSVAYFSDKVDIEERNFRASREENRIEKLKSRTKVATVEKYVDLYSKIGIRDSDLEANLWFPLFLYLSEYEHKLRTNVKQFIKKDKKDNERYVKRILREVISKEVDFIAESATGNPAFEDYVNQGFTSSKSFKEVYYDYEDKREDIVEGKKKNELALIGRGSVKAGFRFGEFNERNFVYDNTRKVIHLYGFNAVILNQDINPWFIPERRVPGFDILIAEKKVTFDEMKALKSKCIKILRERAKKAGILETAQENGEEALKEFFNLVLEEKVQDVVFHKDALLFHADEILEDGIIAVDELGTIATVYQKNLKLIQTSESSAIKSRREQLLKTFLQHLQAFEIKYTVSLSSSDTISIPFNYYTRHIPVLLADGMLIDSIAGREDFQSELAFTRKLRYDPATDSKEKPYRSISRSMSYWFVDSLQYLTDFNVFVDHLLKSPRFLGVFHGEEVNRIADSPENIVLGDSLVAIDSLDEYYRDDSMEEIVFLKYIEDTSYENVERYDIQDSLFQTHVLDDQMEFTYLWVANDTTFNERVDALLPPPDPFELAKSKVDKFAVRTRDTVEYFVTNQRTDTIKLYRLKERGEETTFQLDGVNYQFGGSLTRKLALEDDFCVEVEVVDGQSNKFLAYKYPGAYLDNFLVSKSEVSTTWYKYDSVTQVTRENVLDYSDVLGIPADSSVGNGLTSEQLAIRWAIEERRKTYQSKGDVGKFRMRSNNFIQSDSTVAKTVNDAKEGVTEFMGKVRKQINSL